MPNHIMWCNTELNTQYFPVIHFKFRCPPDKQIKYLCGLIITFPNFFISNQHHSHHLTVRCTLCTLCPFTQTHNSACKVQIFTAPCSPAMIHVLHLHPSSLYESTHHGMQGLVRALNVANWDKQYFYNVGQK